jgi:hypothetical protein
MKTTLLLFATLVYFQNLSQVNAQEEPILALVTTIDPKAATGILFEPNGNLELAYWKDNYVQVTINVADNGFSRQQVKALIPTGMFKIEQYQEGGQLKLTIPGLKRNATINGKPVIGKVSFLITLPSNMSFKRVSNENTSINAVDINSVQANNGGSNK